MAESGEFLVDRSSGAVGASQRPMRGYAVPGSKGELFPIFQLGLGIKLLGRDTDRGYLDERAVPFPGGHLDRVPFEVGLKLDLEIEEI